MMTTNMKKAFAYMEELEKKGLIVSLKNLTNHDCIINPIDFAKVQEYERDHPEEYSGDNVLVLSPKDPWVKLAAGQMSAFNRMFVK